MSATPAAPTFTWLYDNIFHGYCSDRNQPCHNPGMNRGVSFSNRDAAFRSVQLYVVPGDYLRLGPLLPDQRGRHAAHQPARSRADLQAALAAYGSTPGALDN